MSITVPLLRDSVRLTADAVAAYQPSAGFERQELEDLVDASLATLNLIRSVEGRYRYRRERDQVPLDRPYYEGIHAAYLDWYNSAGALLTRVEEFESRGKRLANSGAYRDACRSSHVAALDPECLNESQQQIEEGRVRPLGEVVDELLRRPNGAGQRIIGKVAG